MIDLSVPLQELFGANIKLDSVRSVSGGDINSAYMLILNDGYRLFLKENMQQNVRYFEAGVDCGVDCKVWVETTGGRYFVFGVK